MSIRIDSIVGKEEGRVAWKQASELYGPGPTTEQFLSVVIKRLAERVQKIELELERQASYREEQSEKE